MRNVIIGIHGLGNKPPKEILESWWIQSILEGAKRHDVSFEEVDFELVYWTDILHPVPLDARIAEPDNPLYLSDPYIPKMYFRKTGPHSLRKKIADYIENKLSKILMNDDFTINYKSVTDSLIRKYFKDLEQYYAETTDDKDGCPCARDRIRERLIEVLRKYKHDRILLLAHSMGSIVAFDVLDMNPDLKVDTFITIGSPLGLPIVIARMAQERRDKHQESKVLRIPDTIQKKWYNLADLEDNVAFDFKIEDDFSENSYGVKPVDIQVENDYEHRRKRNPHKSYGYLRTAELVNLINAFSRERKESGFERAVTWLRELFSKKRKAAAVTLTGMDSSIPLSLPDLTVSQVIDNGDFDRNKALGQIRKQETVWDFIVIGGGATGVGVAVDAAARGYKTLLLEQHDFGKATSSRSTKLIHGGVRYLQQGNISLVLEALHERAILRNNAPHLVHDLPFIVPNYDWWEGPFYGIGLRVYDMLAGRHGFGPSINLSPEETIERIPKIETESLRGGVQYHDGQFDDSRLVINLAQTAVDEGATVLNYMEVTSLEKEGSLISGVHAKDILKGEEFSLQARCVINATGIFTDQIRKMDDASCKPVMKTSRGVHIVLDESFLGGNTAIMVPHTDDGRVMFAIPWLGRTLIGTTDTEVETPELEPAASKEEISFILSHAAKYLTHDPEPDDIKSVFAGLRPLVSQGTDENTAAISREHQILISPAGLVSITGGKWTTYRLMAKETIDKAIAIAKLEYIHAQTKDLAIHGWVKNSPVFGLLAQYGVDAYKIEMLLDKDPGLAKQLHPDLPITKGMVVWAVRNEMACTVEDVLARRTRCLLLDARASMEIAKDVAKLMAGELGENKNWIAQQVEDYKQLAARYLP